MYVRVKREKLTIFLHVEPTDTAPANQRLFKNETRLEDGKTLAELGVVNDDVLGLALKQEGAYGSFEPVLIVEPDAAEENG
eukprot:scaffold8.g1543.t1